MYLAAMAAPADMELLHALSHPIMGEMGNDRTAIFAPCDPQQPFRLVELPARDEAEGLTYVVLQGARVVALRASRKLNHTLRTRKRVSNWQPSQMRVTEPRREQELPSADPSAWDGTGKTIPRPAMHVTNIARRAHVWRSMLGPYLGADTRIILDGQACSRYPFYRYFEFSIIVYEKGLMPY